jgi:D-glycero-alpha-D-manno-heptose-7-phosphate kinase
MAVTSALTISVRLAETGFAELCAGRIDGFGAMLREAWAVKKEMTSGISSALIDEAYAAALSAGAEGGKLLGAGGGGFLMFFAQPSRHDAIRAALSSLREVPFRFAREGSGIIFVH